MTTIRTVAAHQVVQSVHPRPVTEADAVGIATGRAVDTALADANYQMSQGRRPSVTATIRHATELFDAAIEETDVEVTPELRARVEEEVAGVVRAFRESELFGRLRPKSRLILIAEEVGVYAQPDFWNGRDRFYEMKSYAADPIPPDVALQLGLFQLAFPECTAVLATFDRFARPVRPVLRSIPPPTDDARARLLTTAHRIGKESGAPKVLEYVDHPAVRYPSPR